MKIQVIKVFVTILTLNILFSVGEVFAQQQKVSGQGCANIQLYKYKDGALQDFTDQERKNGVELTCDERSVLLSPLGFAPNVPDEEKGSYEFEKIDYNPPQAFNKGTKISLPHDDCWSKMFSFSNYFPVTANSDVPKFQFYFYDKTYETLLVNSNGGVHLFDSDSRLLQYAKNNNINLYNEPTGMNYLYCPYAYSQAFPDSRDTWTGGYLQSVNPTFNSINGPFCDIDYGRASNDQGMYIDFVGEYPCRKCIISFNDIPMFGNYGASDTANITSMIVLYETTGAIEFYLKQKPYYTATNGSNAVLGIQNSDGTAATVITNNAYDPDNKGTTTTQSYNSTAWKAKEEAWRIKPVGDLIPKYTWYKKKPGDSDNNLIPLGNGDANGNYSAAPDQEDGPTYYYCEMPLSRIEDGGEFSVWDSILVIPAPVPNVVITHNSADNPQTVSMNQWSTYQYDTVCAGDRVTFTFSGGDEYEFIEPAALKDVKIVNGTVTVEQDATVDEVHYQFEIRNYKDGQLVCTSTEDVYIFNRRIRVDIGEDTSICKAQQVYFEDNIKDYENSLKDKNCKFQWSYTGGGLVNMTTEKAEFVPQSSGILGLTITDNRYCSATDEANVEVIPVPDLKIDGATELCEGTSTTLTAKQDLNDVTYLWNTGSEESSIIETPEQATDYEVTVTTNTANCSSTAKVTVNVYPIPTIEMHKDSKICEGETAVIGVTGDAERYLWQSSDVSVNGGDLTEYTVSPDLTTRYTVTAYNNPQLNCSSVGSVTVFVEKKPAPTIQMDPNYIDELTPVVTFTDATVGVVSRLWEISDGATSADKNFRHTFSLDDTTITFYVTLTGTTSYGCTDSVTMPISVVREHHIWAPTGIYLHSVNPINAQFRMTIDAVSEFNLKIFNRWGGIVFETNDINEAWDCKVNGKYVNQGVYTWYASYRHKDSPDRLMQKSGTFMIYN